ncbi:MAG: hypothetical protein D4R88_09910 [Methanosarcinales archaeon]|nr:MAG: hypothetical protein D4R88_09910 [Methanosarcinales archaeon]
MIKPNFSESQLQQLVNTEITMQLYFHKKIFINPTIVNLIQEYKLGWDTAFYFPWLLVPPNPNHKGCNFFIQYKLSRLIEGHRGKEWGYWNSPYFRFQIPYSTKDINNRSFDDYHQFECLKDLANQGYNVFYATNHVVYNDELFDIAANQQLLDEIPFLDVSKISGRHKKVTFDQHYSHFVLHSEPIEIQINRWSSILNTIKESNKTTIFNDLEFLKNLLLEFENNVMKINEGGFSSEIRRIENIEDNNIKIVIKALIISKYLMRYLDIYWLNYYSDI